MSEMAQGACLVSSCEDAEAAEDRRLRAAGSTASACTCGRRSRVYGVIHARMQCWQHMVARKRKVKT